MRCTNYDERIRFIMKVIQQDRYYVFMYSYFILTPILSFYLIQNEMMALIFLAILCCILGSHLGLIEADDNLNMKKTIKMLIFLFLILAFVAFCFNLPDNMPTYF